MKNLYSFLGKDGYKVIYTTQLDNFIILMILKGLLRILKICYDLLCKQFDYKDSYMIEMPKNPELTVTLGTDLAYMQREFGIDALMEYGASELMSHSEELWVQFDLYLELVLGQNRQFKKAIVGDDPNDWEEDQDA